MEPLNGAATSTRNSETGAVDYGALLKEALDAQLPWSRKLSVRMVDAIEALVAENAKLREDDAANWLALHAEHCDNTNPYHEDGSHCWYPRRTDA